ncbi:S-adenosyl-L-methionine-dependent methyltransferase [Choiromyces venosus 120613-1]|uniref:S-adenosyl-L-methionine-dependent methyltransferase n=1 Tax=Choiromyces venosus 120613-1 TaxID=1336337 RepID=A0A3N4JTC9_9PEZI|nr:S-adenosyl-L-methionine-dependent methyltransferase [Choiromyces venosus 120613-1]
MDIVDPEEYEASHVHRVYEHIAPHFSATRFKPWPIVEKFLCNLPIGAVGLDVGCGNGKYLTVNPNVFIVGSDRSSSLIGIARGRKIQDSFVADALDLPHPDSRFDFAISIAVIHHFSSPERRCHALKSILATLKVPNDNSDGGRALIYVWALEQKNSRRGWDEGDQQDVFVPWVMSKQFSSTNAKAKGKGRDEKLTYMRYYHLYRKGELEADIARAGGRVQESGYEKDNWWAICGPVR